MGYEVIFKFPMIPFKIPLESQFSQDPLHCFLYSSSPALWIPYVFGIYGKVFSSCIWAWQFPGARIIFHETRRHLPEHGLYHILSISLLSTRDYPYQDLSPFHSSGTTAVPHRFWEYWGGF